MRKTVKKAIIPAAGLGTRFLPATKSQPKEMLPIVDKPTLQTPYINKERVKCHLIKSWKFLIPQFSILIYTSLDKVILGNLTNMTEVAYYDQSQKIIRIAVSLISSVGVALLPRMTYLVQNNKREEFNNLLTMGR